MWWQDHYKTLAFKTLAFWQLVIEQYNARFIIKVDDDNYVRLDRLAIAVRQWEDIGAGALPFLTGPALVPGWTVLPAHSQGESSTHSGTQARGAGVGHAESRCTDFLFAELQAPLLLACPVHSALNLPTLVEARSALGAGCCRY